MWQPIYSRILEELQTEFRNSGSLCLVWLTEWVLGDGCIVTRFLQCTWKLQRTPRHTRRRRHTVRRTAPCVFFCSILAWYHWWEFFSVKFGNFTPHRKNKQKVAWRKSTALPTERRPLFFLCKPQQQIVWTKHTAALTRRVIHKRLTFTGVPLVFDSSKREGFLFQFEGVYTFQFKPCSKQSYINIIPWHAKSENGGNRWCQTPSFSERFAVLHHYSGSKQENLLSRSELICP